MGEKPGNEGDRRGSDALLERDAAEAGGSESAGESAKATGGAGKGDIPGGPAEATNLNSSRSNIYRSGAPGGPDPGEPTEGSNLNSSKSNIYRSGEPGSPDPGEPAEAANLNSSKSNIYRAGAPNEDPAAEPDAPSAPPGRTS